MVFSNSSIFSSSFLTGIVSISTLIFLVKSIKRRSIQNKQNTPKRSRQIPLTEYGKRINLNTFDISVIPSRSISTVTIFEIENGQHPPIKMIQDRVFKIIEANPWLCGCFVEKEEVKQQGSIETPRNIQLWVPNKASILAKSLSGHMKTFSHHIVHNLKISLENPSRFIVDTFQGSVNDESSPVFKVSVLSTTPSKDSKSIRKLALIVSMNHVLGDAATFYSIYKMLNFETEIVQLCPDRVFPQELSEIQTKMTENLKLKAVEHKPPTSYQKVMNTLKFYFRPNLVPVYWKVDPLWIQENKAKHAKIICQRQSFRSRPGTTKTAHYISTNDLLMSKIIPRNMFCYMPVNLRGKIYSTNLAGNYLYSLGVTPENHRKAENVRSLIEDYFPKGPRTWTVVHPPESSSFDHNGIAVVTNWAEFFEDIQIPHLKSLIHFPIYIPLKPITDNSFDFHMTVIFKYNKADVGMRIMSRYPQSRLKGIASEVFPISHALA